MTKEEVKQTSSFDSWPTDFRNKCTMTDAALLLKNFSIINLCNKSVVYDKVHLFLKSVCHESLVVFSPFRSVFLPS